MLKERARTLAIAVLIVDLGLVGLAFVVAHSIRRTLLPAWGLVSEQFYSLAQYLPLLPLAVALWAVFLLSSGTYRSHRMITLPSEARDLARTAMLSGLTFSFVIFFFQLDQRLLDSDNVSRSWVFVFIALTFAFQVAEKIALRLTARYVRKRGYNFRTVLIVGTDPLASAIANSINLHRYWGIRVVGFLGASTDATEAEAEPGPRLGDIGALGDIVEAEAVDEVVLTVDPHEEPALVENLLRVQELGVLIRFAFNPLPSATGKMRLSEVDGIPLVSWSPSPGTPVQLFAKRLVDILVAAFLLLALSPLLLLVALAIKLTSSGPILFRQSRHGLNGRVFTILKFRTMIENAEQEREEIAVLNEMSGPVFKIRNDPRVTPVGKLLRRYSLDELPQLWNVLRGEMSLVGPRPPALDEVQAYDRWQKRRLSMRPGLTCLWQVGGRNTIDFDRWMELDLAYIDNWSPWLDLKILLKTIPVVLSGKGAY